MSISAAVAGQHHRVRVWTGDGSDDPEGSGQGAQAPAVPVALPPATSVAPPAAGSLAAVLGASGLVHGGAGPAIAADRSAAPPVAAVDSQTRLGQALSTLVDALTSLQGPSPADGASSDPARSAVDSAIDTLRSALVPSATAAQPGMAAAGTTAAAPVETPPRPNLDALNRVLSHYAAQSAAANIPYTLGD